MYFIVYLYQVYQLFAYTYIINIISTFQTKLKLYLTKIFTYTSIEYKYILA